MSNPYQEPSAPPPQVEPAFIPLLTHELRTPLAAIKGFTSLLLRYHQQFSPREQRELFEEIALGCDRLEDAVAHAVAISEIAAGTRSLTSVVVDLAQLVRTVLAPLAPDMPRTGASRWQYHLSIVPERAMPVVGDARELARVLMHLLEFARQSAPDGGMIALTVQPWQRDTASINSVADAPFWEIQVGDCGSDAALEALQHLLDEHPSDDLDLVHHSTTLMLALLYCKRIVSLHGGRMWADVQPTHGTTLHVILPATELVAESV